MSPLACMEMWTFCSQEARTMSEPTCQGSWNSLYFDRSTSNRAFRCLMKPTLRRTPSFPESLPIILAEMNEKLQESLRVVTETIDGLARIDELRELLSPKEIAALNQAKMDLLVILKALVERISQNINELKDTNSLK